MNEQDKQLLLQDLCARLPYGVVFMGNKEWNRKPYQLTCDEVQYAMMSDDWDDVPYLRPMSSMTDEERKEYELLANHCIVTSTGFVHFEVVVLIDWLNAHYFDYRCLIEKGLSLPAPEGMYNFKI